MQPKRDAADTAENKQHFAEILPIGSRVAETPPTSPRRPRRLHAQSSVAPATATSDGRRTAGHHGKARAGPKSLQIFSGLGLGCKSKRNFARKYAFESIFQALQDLHTFAPLQSQKLTKNRFEKSASFVKIQQKFSKCRKLWKFLPNFKNFR